MPPEMRLDICRYLLYSWEWRLISQIVNLKYDTSYSTDELKVVYEVDRLLEH